MNLHIVILAAGKGTRMRSSVPKVLHHVAGKPMLAHVLHKAQQLHPAKIHVVYSAEQVKEQLASYPVTWVFQEQQLGTGHAVLQALPGIPSDAWVLVLYGDVPLVTASLLQALVVQHGAIKLVTADVAEPQGFGRIIRKAGQICAIVEEQDATSLQRQIHEINTGILSAAASVFNKYLPQVTPVNAQQEYYLTDMIALAVADGVSILGHQATYQEILGINDKHQLAQAERIIQHQIAQELLSQGVTILDPSRLEVRGEVHIAQDVTLDVNVILAGRVTIGAGCTIGPNCYLQDVSLGNQVTVRANSVLEGAVIEDHCVIGPFARIRPQTYLAAHAQVGNFVEVKNTTIGAFSKANHLSYLGDAVLGSKVNIGAGTITCNYDGHKKHPTVIQDGAFIGSNSSLVAPVTIGYQATIGAGSTIVSEVPEQALALSRVPQVVIPNWKRKHDKAA